MQELEFRYLFLLRKVTGFKSYGDVFGRNQSLPRTLLVKAKALVILDQKLRLVAAYLAPLGPLRGTPDPRDGQ